jgi:hypothetical protein
VSFVKPYYSHSRKLLLILSPYVPFFHSHFQYSHCITRPTHALFHSVPTRTPLHSLIPLFPLSFTQPVCLVHRGFHFFIFIYSVISTVTPRLSRARSARTKHIFSFAFCTLSTRLQHSPACACCHFVVYRRAH